MKRWIAVLAIVAGASSASAGTIGFDPMDTLVDRNTDSPIVMIDLFVQSTTLTSFTAVDVVVGSNDGLDLTDFIFDPNIMGLLENVENPGPGKYLDDIKFGYFGDPLSSGVDLGTLVVDTTGLPNGTYNLIVDWEQDGARSKLTDTVGSNLDYVTGGGTITIVPEPATLALLGLGLVGVVRRRRSTII